DQQPSQRPARWFGVLLDPHKQRRRQLTGESLLRFQRSERTQIDYRDSRVLTGPIISKQHRWIEHLAGVADHWIDLFEHAQSIRKLARQRRPSVDAERSLRRQIGEQ